MSEDEDSIYLKSVASLGDTHEVVTNQDIYSETGIKLVSCGSRINSSFYDRLIRHKLVQNPDECMTVEGGVSTQELLSRARALFESGSALPGITGLVEMDRLWAAVSKINLNNTLSFKLTVAREKRSKLFDHSLRIMLLSLYLGLRTGLSESELVALATAAAFHDLGELHIDPEILDKQHALTPGERRHIYAHPMTAYMILKNFPIYHPLVSTIVLEHHEYLDGSGYPVGLSGGKIGNLSQILAIAEVADGIQNRKRLEIVLKLNKHKLNTNLIGLVSELFRPGTETSDTNRNSEDIGKTITLLAASFDEWDKLRQARGGDTPVVKFANQRIQNLRHALFDAGFNPNEPGWLISGIENDAEGLLDVEALISESAWQLKSIARELDKFWTDESGEEVKAWIGNCIQKMVN